MRNTHVLGGQDRGYGDMKGTTEEVMLGRGGWIRGIEKLGTMWRQGWAGFGENRAKRVRGELPKVPHGGRWGKEDMACWDVRLNRGHGSQGKLCTFSLACQCDPRSLRGPVV